MSDLSVFKKSAQSKIASDDMWPIKNVRRETPHWNYCKCPTGFFSGQRSDFGSPGALFSPIPFQRASSYWFWIKRFEQPIYSFPPKKIRLNASWTAREPQKRPEAIYGNSPQSWPLKTWNRANSSHTLLLALLSILLSLMGRLQKTTWRRLT